MSGDNASAGLLPVRLRQEGRGAPMARRESGSTHRRGSYLRRQQGVFPIPTAHSRYLRSRWSATRSTAEVSFAVRDVVEIPNHRRRQAQKHGGLQYRDRTSDGIIGALAFLASAVNGCKTMLQILQIMDRGHAGLLLFQLVSARLVRRGRALVGQLLLDLR
jgi:hypothetical protein